MVTLQRRLSRASVVGFLTLLLACTPPPTDDVASAPTPTMALDLADAPTVLLGDGANGTPLFFRFRDATRLLDGRIVVADDTEYMFVFDEAGLLLDTWGGKGEGPGEYGRIEWIQRLAGDTIAAYDFQVSRMTFVSPTGDFVRSLRMEPRLGVPSGILADGSLIGRLRRVDAVHVTPRISFDVMEVVAFSQDQERAESLGRFVDGWGMHILSALDLTTISGSHVPVPPALPQTFRAVGTDRMYFVTGETFEISEAVPGVGVRTFARRSDVQPRVLTQDAFDAGLLTDRIDSTGDPTVLATQLGVVIPDDPPIPAPVTLGLLVDGLDHVWVQAFPDDWFGPTEWSVFDPGGALLGEAILPPRFTPTEIGENYVLGVRVGELNVEYVELWELTRTPLAP